MHTIGLSFIASFFFLPIKINSKVESPYSSSQRLDLGSAINILVFASFHNVVQVFDVILSRCRDYGG